MTGSLRLTRQDIPTVALSTVASVSLAAIFWVVAHHPIAPPAEATQQRPAHQLHHARTLPVLHPSPTVRAPIYQVLAQQQPVARTATTVRRPFPTSSPSPQPSPATPGLCAGVLELANICVPLGGH